MRMHVLACVGLVSVACDATGSGPAGTNESGLQQGPQGSAGPAGDRGPKGPDGPKGPTGPAGDEGEPGYPGNVGSPGAAGADGPQGPQGPRGADGARGADGPRGPRGADGETGSPGAQGPQGFQGPQGPAGLTGATGPSGLQGPPGVVGPQGATGAAGFIGAQGATGPQGPPGVTIGAPEGPIGPQGAIGPAGPTGPDGPTGPAGEAGLVGAACWDLDADGVGDDSEDVNEDGTADGRDCPAGVPADFACTQGWIKAWNGESWFCKLAPFESTDDTYVLHEEFFTEPRTLDLFTGEVVPDYGGVIRIDNQGGGGFRTTQAMRLVVGGGVRLGFRPATLDDVSAFGLTVANDDESVQPLVLGVQGETWLTLCDVGGGGDAVPLSFEPPAGPYTSFAIERYPDHFRFYVNDVEVARRTDCVLSEDADGFFFLAIGEGSYEIDYFTVRSPRNFAAGGPT